MSAPTLKRYRVTVIEWLTHSAIITPTGTSAAEHGARRMWHENAEHDVFRFIESGIDGVQVEELDQAGDSPAAGSQASSASETGPPLEAALYLD
jgi:hypothetical protein